VGAVYAILVLVTMANKAARIAEDRKAFSNRKIEKPQSSPTTVNRFWEQRTIEELALEQGVRPLDRLEEILGKGKGLWKTDGEFEGFVRDIYQRRREDRERRE